VLCGLTVIHTKNGNEFSLKLRDSFVFVVPVSSSCYCYCLVTSVSLTHACSCRSVIDRCCLLHHAAVVSSLSSSSSLRPDAKLSLNSSISRHRSVVMAGVCVCVRAVRGTSAGQVGSVDGRRRQLQRDPALTRPDHFSPRASPSTYLQNS